MMDLREFYGKRVEKIKLALSEGEFPNEEYLEVLPFPDNFYKKFRKIQVMLRDRVRGTVIVISEDKLVRDSYVVLDYRRERLIVGNAEEIGLPMMIEGFDMIDSLERAHQEKNFKKESFFLSSKLEPEYLARKYSALYNYVLEYFMRRKRKMISYSEFNSLLYKKELKDFKMEKREEIEKLSDFNLVDVELFSHEIRYYLSHPELIRNDYLKAFISNLIEIEINNDYQYPISINKVYYDRAADQVIILSNEKEIRNNLVILDYVDQRVLVGCNEKVLKEIPLEEIYEKEGAFFTSNCNHPDYLFSKLAVTYLRLEKGREDLDNDA